MHRAAPKLSNSGMLKQLHWLTVVMQRERSRQCMLLSDTPGLA